MKKSLPFHGVLYHLVFLYFSTALQVDFVLHNKKITAVKDFKAAQPMRGLILDQCNEKIKFITNLCCPFSTNYRRSHQRCSMKKSFLRNFTKFTGKHLCQSLFFNKIAALRPATLLKKRLWHRCFLWILRSFEERLFYRTPQEDCFYNILDLYRHLHCNSKY